MKFKIEKTAMRISRVEGIGGDFYWRGASIPKTL